MRSTHADPLRSTPLIYTPNLSRPGESRALAISIPCRRLLSRGSLQAARSRRIHRSKSPGSYVNTRPTPLAPKPRCSQSSQRIDCDHPPVSRQNPPKIVTDRPPKVLPPFARCLPQWQDEWSSELGASLSGRNASTVTKQDRRPTQSYHVLLRMCDPGRRIQALRAARLARP